MRLLLILLGLPAFSQTAITALTAFWEMNPSAVDKIIWDSKGSRHGQHFLTGPILPATIFGGGVKQDETMTFGAYIPASYINTTGSFTIAVWCRHYSTNKIISRLEYPNLWIANFNTETNGRFQWGDRIMPDGSYNKNAGTLALVWMAYDGVNTKIAVDDSSWESGTAPVGFSNNDPSLPMKIAQNNFAAEYGATTGRMMFWDGYIPSDAERIAIYNSGSGRDYAYFDAAGYTPPTRPLTVTLANANFARDIDLTDQGLYWLRPFPVKNWNASIRAAFGYDYAWVRTKDHTACGGAGDAVFLGGSNSPAALPTTWTAIITAASVSAQDPSKNWCQMHPPHLVYNPDTELVHLYFNAMKDPYTVQWSGLVETSPDMATWTFAGEAFPYGATVDGTPINHGGYAMVKRIGTGNWQAATLINSTAYAVRHGLWTSTDGITWTFSSVTKNITPAVPYFVWPPATPISNNALVANYYANPTESNPLVSQFPAWELFMHDGTGIDGDWLQDVRTYEEDGTVYIYAKWSFEEPATTRLFTGTLIGSGLTRGISGAARISGKVTLQ